MERLLDGGPSPERQIVRLIQEARSLYTRFSRILKPWFRQEDGDMVIPETASSVESFRLEVGSARENIKVDIGSNREQGALSVLNHEEPK